MERTGRLSEWTGRALLDHYVLVAGYSENRFALLDPVLGFRTISAARLARYRSEFDEAAIVFSARAPGQEQAAR